MPAEVEEVESVGPAEGVVGPMGLVEAEGVGPEEPAEEEAVEPAGAVREAEVEAAGLVEPGEPGGEQPEEPWVLLEGCLLPEVGGVDPVQLDLAE